MTKLVFKVASDWEEIVRLRSEIVKLKNELVDNATKADVEMEGKFKKKIFDISKKLF